MSSSSPQDPLVRRIAFLKQVPLFTDLAETELKAMINDFRIREYATGETIFRQGDISRELCVVVKGKVRVFKISPSGNETSIQVFSDHDIIGEFATIDSRPRSATAKAINRCTLLAMAGERFRQHMREFPELALAMCQLLVDKVRWTASYAESVAQYDCAGRLLHILLSYNEQFGEEEEGGKRYVLDLALNQADLASLVGTRREWVNRILADWRKRGLIEYENGTITIIDLPRVQEERDSRIEACGETW